MIRPATLDDLPRLVVMGRRFLAESPYAALIPENAEQMASTVAVMLDSPVATILVTEIDGSVVGMLGLIVQKHLLSGEQVAGELFWWIEPEARGQGVRLWAAGEQWAREQGAVMMQMIAPDARVGQLYERRGYHLAEQMYVRRF